MSQPTEAEMNQRVNEVLKNALDPLLRIRRLTKTVLKDKTNHVFWLDSNTYTKYPYTSVEKVNPECPPCPTSTSPDPTSTSTKSS